MITGIRFKKYLPFSRWGAVLWPVLIGLVFLYPAWAEEQASPALYYKVSLEGLPDGSLKEVLVSISDTFGWQNRPPASLHLLKRRVERDMPEFLRVMRSEGYFKAEVRPRIEAEAKPVQVVFRVTLGPPFLISGVTIEASPPSRDYQTVLPEPIELGLALGQQFRAKGVVKAQEQLLSRLGRAGFPFPEIKDREILADHASDTVRITLRVNPGPRAVFGEVQIQGADSVDEEYVIRQLPWRIGDEFKASLLAEARIKLIGTGLFSVVEVVRGQVDENGRLPVIINLKERSHRTIRTGVGYWSDLGPEAKLEWEHRNAFGAGEKLDAALKWNEIKQSLEGGFLKPGFLSAGQSLRLKASVSGERSEAYTSEGVEVSAAVDRRLTEMTSVGFGVRYRLTTLQTLLQEESFGLFSAPVFLNRDSSDDLLDPSRGGRLNLELAPFTDTRQKSTGFIKVRASYHHYLELLSKKRLILAGRAALGLIDGAGRDQVPADELFYAGGGGSVRGYSYQTAGEMKGDEPLGGLALVELSGELRAKFTDSLGLAAFIDGGRAYAAATELEEKLFWGTGLGLRYYTPIGPLRLDLAVPLDKREGVDSRYQLYFSLGQAF